MPNGEPPNTKSGYTKKTTMLLYSASVTCLLYKYFFIPSVPNNQMYFLLYSYHILQ